MRASDQAQLRVARKLDHDPSVPRAHRTGAPRDTLVWETRLQATTRRTGAPQPLKRTKPAIRRLRKAIEGLTGL